MKTGLIIFGILLLAVGVGLFYWGNTQMNETAGLLGQVERFLSPAARAEQTSAQIMKVGGLVVGVIGLGMTVFGLTSRDKS